MHVCNDCAHLDPEKEFFICANELLEDMRSFDREEARLKKNAQARTRRRNNRSLVNVLKSIQAQKGAK